LTPVGPEASEQEHGAEHEAKRIGAVNVAGKDRGNGREADKGETPEAPRT
jgi:hypothetical protein